MRGGFHVSAVYRDFNLPENHQLIFGFSRKVQNLLMHPSKPTLKEFTDQVLGTFYRACV